MAEDGGKRADESEEVRRSIKFHQGGASIDMSPENGCASCWPEAAAWVSSAVATGVIGNIAYATIKVAFLRLRSGLRASPKAPVNLQEHWLLAKLSVQARCAEIGRPAPRLEELGELSWHYADRSYHLTTKGPTLRAVVVIPEGDLDGTRLVTTLYFAE